MICVFGDEVREAIYTDVNVTLNKLMSENKPLNLNDLINDYYAESVESVGQDNALGLIQLIPDYVYYSLADSKELDRHFAGMDFNMNELRDLRLSFENPDNVTEFVSVDKTTGDIAEEEREITNTVSEEKRENGGTKIPKSLSFRPEGAMVTYGYESNRKDEIWNEDSHFAYGFLRKINSEMVNVRDFKSLTFNGHTGFRLNMVKGSELAEKGNLYPAQEAYSKKSEQNKKTIDEGAFVVLTDNQGNTLYFDENYNISTEKQDGAKAIYFTTRKPEKDSNGNYKHEVGYDGKSKSSLQTVEEIANTHEISSEQAFDMQQAEFNELVDLQTELLDTNESILLDIEFLSPGFPIESATQRNVPANKLNIPATYKDHYVTYDDRTKGYGITLVNPAHSDYIPIASVKLSQALQDVVTELLFNEKLQDPSKFGDDKVLKANERHELLSKILGAKSVIKYNYSKDKVLFTNINVGINENGETKNLMNPTKEEFVNTFFKSAAGDGDYVDGKLVNAKNRFFIQKALLDQGRVKMGTSVEGDNLNISEVNYSDVVLENSLIKGQTFKKQSGEELVMRAHPYFKFVESNESIQKRAERANSKMKDSQDSLEDTDEFGGNPFTQRDVNASDLLRSKKLDKGVTEQQIKDAEKWYKSTDLNKHLGYKQAFNIVNSDAYATFNSSGITLYSGSDATDLYHEAWHAFTQLYLTVNDKKALYNEVKKLSGSFKDHTGKTVKFKDASYLQIEEYLAEDFRSYMLSNGKKTLEGRSKTNSIFKKILNFLREMFGGTRAVDSTTVNTQAKVKELYDKLRVGNLNEYNASVKNMMFGKLNKSKIKPAPGKLFDLSYDETNQVMKAFDSLVSQHLDQMNASQNTNKFTSNFLTDPSIQENAYYYAYEQLYKAYKEKSYPEDESGRTSAIINQVLGSMKNVAAYHTENSGFIQETLSDEAKLDMIEEIEQETVTDEQASIELIKSSNINPNTYVTNTIDYIISTLPYKEGDIMLVDRFGVQVLADKYKVMNIMHDIVGEAVGPQELYDKLVDYSQTNKPYSSVIDILKNRLSNPTDLAQQGGNIGPMDTWFQMNKSFGLYDHATVITLNRRRESKEGKKYYDLVHKLNRIDVENTKKAIDSYFRITTSNDHMIKYDDRYGNVLDAKAVYAKWGNEKVKTSNILEFLNDIGYEVPYSEEFKRELYKAIGTGKIKLDKFKFIIKNIKAAAEDTTGEKVITSLGEKSGGLFGNSGSLIDPILEVTAKYRPDINIKMTSNGSGDPIHTLDQHSSQTRLISGLNKAEHMDQFNDIEQVENAIPYLQHLSTRNPATAANAVLKALFDETGKRTNNEIKTGLLMGVSVIEDKVKLKGDKSTALSRQDKLIEDLHLMLMRGGSAMMRYGTKGKETYISVENLTSNEDKYLYIDIKNFKDQNLDQANAEFTQRMLGWIDAEIVRMIEFNKKDSPYEKVYNYGGFKENAKDFFFFKKILKPETQERLKNYYSIEQDQSTPDNLVLLTQTHLHDQELSEIRDMIYNDLSFFMEKAVDLELKNFRELPYISSNLRKKLVDRTEVKDQNELEKIAVRAHTYNYMLRNLDMMGILYGDPVQFNMAKEDFHKRIGAIASGGIQFADDAAARSFINSTVGRPYAASKEFDSGYSQWGNTIRTAVVKDVDVKSVEYDNMVKTYTEVFNMEKKEAEDRLGSYEKMTEADAQGLISFDTYRILSILSGKWDWQKQEPLFNKIVNGQKVDQKDMAKYFPPRKYQYYGNMENNLGKDSKFYLPLQAFHKYSLLPLIPGVYGESVERLHDEMIKQGMDYVIFESASKLNTITENGTPDEVYTSYDSVNLSKDRTLKDEIKFTPNNMFLAYLKDQTDVNDKFKTKTSLPSQIRKIILSNLFDGGKETSEENKQKAINYLTTLNKLIELNKKNLVKELGLSYKSDGKTIDFTPAGMEKLAASLQRELSERDLADHELEFIQVDKNGKLKVDLSMSPSAEKLETALVSLVNRRVIKGKVNGEPLVQAASTFITDNDRPTNATEEQLREYGTNGLRFYQYVDGKTNIRAMQVKVSMQGKYRSLLKRKDVKDKAREEGITDLQALNSLLRDEEWLSENRNIITMFGVRIPTQAISSADVMEIAEFLPEASGNIIIPPSEIVAKTGSDFDVDKMFIMMANMATANGETNLYTYDESITDAQQDKAKSDIKELNKKKKELLSNRISQQEKSEVWSEFNETIDTIYKDIRALQRDTEANPTNEIENEEKINVYENLVSSLIEERDELVKDTELKNVLNKISDNQKILAASSPEALQNDLMYAMIDIMVRPDNFVHLTTSIDGEMAKDKAEEMSKFQDYNPSASLIDNDHAKKGIHAFQIALPSYNVDKHDKNNRGGQALGQGALDVSFKPVFNMLGITLNDKVKETDIEQTILFPHNKSTVEGQGIDLSRLYSKPNEQGQQEDISYTLNLLMNGWVDIEKGAWIFDIQGNQKVEPIIITMLFAGVPFSETIDFVSNPIVREYVDLQISEDAMFTQAYKGPNFKPGKSKIKAIKALFNKYSDIALPADFKDPVNSTAHLAFIQNSREDVIGDSNIDAKQLKGQSAEDVNTNYAFGAFLHFLELEVLASKLTELKLHMNYDTKTSRTLYDSSIKEGNKANLLTGSNYDKEVVKKFLEDSPIGMFDTADFQEQLWSQVFEVRNSSELKSAIKSRLGSFDGFQALQSTFGEGAKAQEEYVKGYINNFLKFMFQEKLIKDVQTKDFYKGIATKRTLSKTEVKGLQYGAAVKDGRLLISREEISKQFDTGLPFDEAASYKLGLAALEADTFIHNNKNLKTEYENFVIEREYLRHSMPVESIVNSPIFKEYVGQVRADNTGSNKTEIQEFPGKSVEDKIQKLAYETVLRDMALSNIYNMNSLFGSKTGTVADQLYRIKQAYPSFVREYSFFQKIVEAPGSGKYKNIRPIESKVKEDTIKAVAENIKTLQNHEDVFVRDFFTKLPMYAFLQSGNNTRSVNSILRYVPQQDFITTISNHLGKITIDKKLTDRYTPLFEKNNKMTNKRKYRFQDYTDLEGVEVTKIKIPEHTKVPGLTKNNSVRLATTLSKDGKVKIYLNPDVTVNSFFEYFTGQTKSDTSNQKKKVLEKLGETGYSLEYLKNLLTTKDLVEKFLLFHENSHVKNYESDNAIYKKAKADESISDHYLAPEVIQVELRATLESIVLTEQYKKTLSESITETLEPTKEVELTESPKDYDIIPLRSDNTNQVVRPNNQTTIVSDRYELFPGVHANEAQRKAIDELVDFILEESDAPFSFSERKDKFRMLKGRGGTGKTTIIEKVVNLIDEQGNYRVGYIAPTHKAKSVLEASLNKSGDKKRSASTLASALGIKLDEATGKFSVDPFVDPSIGDYDVVIIDESSMVNDNLIKRIQETIRPNAAVIFMGDNVQLPPVGQEKDSAAFSSKTKELSQRMRQEDDSPILPITDKIAENVEKEGNAVETVLEPGDRITSFNSENNEGVIYENTIDTAIEMFIADYKANPESTKMITFNNERSNTDLSVKDLNERVRNKLHPNVKAEFIKGDQLTAYNTVVDKKKRPIVENSVDYSVLEVEGVVENDTYRATAKSRAAGTRSHTVTGLKSYVLKVKNNLNGSVRTITVYDKASRNKINQEANKVRQTDKQLAFKINEGFIRMEYGYAVTSHKSQGSTYRNVYVMEDNILGGGNLRSAKQKNQSLYVATSRASNKLVMISMDNSTNNKDLILSKPSQGSHIGKVKTKSATLEQFSDDAVIRNNPVSTFIVEKASNEANTYNLNIDTLTDVFGEDPTLVQENKEKIDSMISDIKEIEETGQSITFFDNYGLSLKKNYPQTFEYLSKRLAEEFGFTNKTYEESVENKIPRGITDETIQQGIQNELEEALNKLNSCKK